MNWWFVFAIIGLIILAYKYAFDHFTIEIIEDDTDDDIDKHT